MDMRWALLVVIAVLGSLQVHALGMGEIDDTSNVRMDPGDTDTYKFFIKGEDVAKTVTFFAKSNGSGLKTNGNQEYYETRTIAANEQAIFSVAMKAEKSGPYVVTWGYKIAPTTTGAGVSMAQTTQKKFNVFVTGTTSGGSSSSGGTTTTTTTKKPSAGGGGAAYVPPKTVTNVSKNTTVVPSTSTSTTPPAKESESANAVDVQSGGVDEMSVMPVVLNIPEEAVIIAKSTEGKLFGVAVLILGALAIGTQILLFKAMGAES